MTKHRPHLVRTESRRSHIFSLVQRKLAIATLFGALQAAAFGQPALISIADKTGGKYGLTVWYSMGEQNMDATPDRDAAVGGYGLNIKYGALSIGIRHVEPVPLTRVTSLFDTITKRCVVHTESYCVLDTTSWVKLSFGLGYLTYFGFESPLLNLTSTFDLGGPYASAFLSAPFDDFGKVKLVVGYTGSSVSVESVEGSFIAPDSTGGPMIHSVTYKIPTSALHELSFGISYKATDDLTAFLEGNRHWVILKNLTYSPVDTLVSKAVVQRSLGSRMDLSYYSLKFGVSVDF